jgi:hypothetical protein
VINKYFIPFFGTYQLTQINYAELDTGTTTTPTGIDTTLEALGKINRRKDTGRQEKVIAK